MKTKRVTQYDRVLKYLQDYNSITSWKAIKEFGVTRLSAVIYNLRQDGYEITSSFKTGKNRYGDYVSYAVYTLQK